MCPHAGTPTTEALRTYDGYVVAFDYRTRNPKWVLEHITKDSSNGDADRYGRVMKITTNHC